MKEQLEDLVEGAEEVEKLQDRRFNPWRIPVTEQVQGVILDVLQQLQSYERLYKLRKRKRRKADQEVFETTVTAIVTDLMYHHLLGHGHGVYITRSNRYLGCKSRYRPHAYGKTLPTILDHLATPEMAFLNMELGHGDPFGPAMETTIRAGKRLITRVVESGIELGDFGISKGQEVIQLKRVKKGGWDDGGLEEYEDTPETILFREQVNTINGWLESVEIDFDEYYWPGGRPVDSRDRRLRRVFTQGRFDSGGRLFGGFWQPLGKEARRKGLMINGEDVVELDYGQMNPRILYGLCGVEPPEGDAYAIPGFQHHRSGVKKIMNAMLFATKRLVRMPKGVRKAFEERHRVEEVMVAIEATHPAITSCFFTGIGHEAQFTESQVLVDVLLTLRDLGIPALPVHDSVIVGKSNQDKVREVMLSCFLKGTGVPGIVEVVGG
ncbi:MAG: hypothetical protein CVU73_02115 [Deltaproteobacteria bacterium HGW-Deltaproteobacteria-8]|nr:MAG: hypothetical protein CVU73_02115 [Deltaproteobacteria bacterium HGW-Deltaproteobacteria-8]